MPNHTPDTSDKQIDEILDGLNYAVDYLKSDYSTSREDDAKYDADHAEELAEAHRQLKRLLLLERIDELKAAKRNNMISGNLVYRVDRRIARLTIQLNQLDTNVKDKEG